MAHLWILLGLFAFWLLISLSLYFVSTLHSAQKQPNAFIAGEPQRRPRVVMNFTFFVFMLFWPVLWLLQKSPVQSYNTAQKITAIVFIIFAMTGLQYLLKSFLKEKD
jgi:hypothetical protein